MTITIDKLAKILQTLFATEADTAAKESGMIQRRRKIYGAGFGQTLVFGWLEHPTTTIDELGDELNVSISLGGVDLGGRPPRSTRPTGSANRLPTDWASCRIRARKRLIVTLSCSV